MCVVVCVCCVGGGVFTEYIHVYVAAMSRILMSYN